MTCFVAHLNKKGYFDELGITVTKENSKAIEVAIAKAVGRSGEHCPAVWKEMNVYLADPKRKAALEKALKREFGRTARR